MSGLLSVHSGVCWTCERAYPAGTPLVRRKDEWIHATCAPGADDE